MVELYQLAITHAESILVENFHTAIFISPPNLDTSTLDVLQDLFRLFILTIIQTRSIEFIVSRVLEPSRLENLTLIVKALLSKIRPHAIRLVDA